MFQKVSRLTLVQDPLVLQYPREQLDGLTIDQFLPRTKGRSNSLPEPLSAFDYIPTSSLDIYEPIPLVIRNYFDDELPRELRLRVFRSLVEVHELDFQRMVANGKWTTSKASSSTGQWVGRAKGIRELFKLSRVRGTLFTGRFILMPSPRCLNRGKS